MRISVALIVFGVVGCGVGGTNIAILFAPPPGPIPPGERGEGRVTIRFNGSGDSWAGRKVRVSVRAPADITAEPADSEATLDGSGSAVIRLSLTPAKDTVAGSRTLAITATGSDTASTTLDVEVAVK